MRKPQRAYRDSLFRDIFNNADRLPEIYEALLGIRTTASDITLATINETLFSGIKNDVGFIVGNQHVLLTEHQSTTNANMPLRMLMYLAEVYRRYVDADAVYRKRLIPLPAPKFYVFYNGIEKMPDTWSLHLSDAFEGRKADLELAVEIININHQPGRPILEKCHALKSYSVFVAKVRESVKSGNALEVAISEAARYCIANNYLEDYFRQKQKSGQRQPITLHLRFAFLGRFRIRPIAQSSAPYGLDSWIGQQEVFDMLNFAWDQERALEVRAEEARADGRQEGQQEGRQEGLTASICNVMHSMNFSVEKAMDVLQIPADERAKYAALVGQRV